MPQDSIYSDQPTTPVTTSVPDHQLEIWEDEAEDMDVSRSEYIRQMVQAGRRGFNLDKEEMTGISDVGVSTRNLETMLIRALEEADDPVGDDDLVASVAGDIEERIDDIIDRLQEENQIKYERGEGWVLNQ